MESQTLAHVQDDRRSGKQLYEDSMMLVSKTSNILQQMTDDQTAMTHKIIQEINRQQSEHRATMRENQRLRIEIARLQAELRSNPKEDGRDVTMNGEAVHDQGSGRKAPPPGS
jgi:hypothetical protein